MKEIVCIGERFYKESQTLMSALYHEQNKGIFYRYDWGHLKLDINAGKELHIRPATKEEISFFEEKLNEHLVKFGYQNGMNAIILNKTDFFDFIYPEIGKPLIMHQKT